MVGDKGDIIFQAGPSENTLQFDHVTSWANVRGRAFFYNYSRDYVERFPCSTVILLGVGVTLPFVASYMHP